MHYWHISFVLTEHCWQAAEGHQSGTSSWNTLMERAVPWCIHSQCRSVAIFFFSFLWVLCNFYYPRSRGFAASLNIKGWVLKIGLLCFKGNGEWYSMISICHVRALKTNDNNLNLFKTGFFLPSAWMSLNRWWRRRPGAANAKLLRLFHAHFVCILEGPVCVHPTDWVLEWLGMLHRVNLSHWFPNRYNWRPCVPFWLHSWPERHRHCCGFCCTGDFTSW